tara:strand:- start:266 stop:415 length:150 start_codon:yes stop_codon:yes gene_type:complete
MRKSAKIGHFSNFLFFGVFKFLDFQDPIILQVLEKRGIFALLRTHQVAT